MRKVFALSSLLVFIVLCSIILISDKTKTEPVFNKADQYYYSFYNLDVSKYDVNTKNIFDYLKTIKIISIYPSNNPIYSKFINIDEYKFNEVLSSKKNISNFINLYNEKLKDNALIKQVEQFNISGIKLNNIYVYASLGEIEELINLYPKIIVNETSEN